ncbi:hypothetical protein [Pontibacillus chungwhensis]|nr:hypothetical protein [Pontibacillus chungwhensis]
MSEPKHHLAILEMYNHLVSSFPTFDILIRYSDNGSEDYKLTKELI